MDSENNNFSYRALSLSPWRVLTWRKFSLRFSRVSTWSSNDRRRMHWHVSIFALRLLPVSSIHEAKHFYIKSGNPDGSRGLYRTPNEARVSAHASDWQRTNHPTLEVEHTSGDHASFLSSDPATLGCYTIGGYITIYGHRFVPGKNFQMLVSPVITPSNYLQKTEQLTTDFGPLMARTPPLICLVPYASVTWCFVPQE